MLKLWFVAAVVAAFLLFGCEVEEDVLCADGGCMTAPLVECKELDCDDEDPCTDDSCNTQTGRCDNEPACDDRNPCTEDICHPANDDKCSNPPGTSLVEIYCTDYNACTAGDRCEAGECVGVPIATCNKGDP